VDRLLTRVVEVREKMHETHEQYMLRRIREEEEATIRSLASSDTPSAIPEVNDIRQMLERIEKKIDKLIEKRG
jgi:ubiquinone biosynthesis protein UbiJ